MSQSAQSSLEYLLILAAFFGVLGVMLPVVFQTTSSFLGAGDDLLAKRVYDDAVEQISLMGFLGSGTIRAFEYSPVQSIVLYSSGNELIVESKNRKYAVDCFSPQLIPKLELSSKFLLIFEKKEENVLVFVVPS